MLWYRNEIHTSTVARFDLADRGLLLGDGLFDTLLVHKSKPHQLERHADRLAIGAAALGIDIGREIIVQAVLALAGAAAPQSLAIRVTVTRGAGPRGLLPQAGAIPTIFATAAPWNEALAFRPLTLATSSIRRNPSSPLSRLKTLGYLDNVLALQEAKKRGAEDALLLSTRGNVACTSTGNLFAIRSDRLLTPPLGDGVLNGTIRARLFELAPNVGLRPEERSISIDDLMTADGIFATNSLRLMMPVASLDGHAVLATESSGAYAALAEALRTDLP